MVERDWVVAERRRARRERIATAVFCVGVAVAVFGAIVWPEDGLESAGPVLVATAAGFVVAVAGLCGMIAFRPGEARRKLAETGGYRDRVQKEWVGRIAILPAASFGLTVIAMSRADEWLSGEDPSLSGVLLAAAAVLNSLLIPVMVMGWDGGSRKQKRLLEDELTRAYRASAITCAFWVLLIGAMGLYLVGLWKPHYAVVALPMVLWSAAATAALRFTQLHQGAEREMEADD
jgi:hypothetical protein